MYMEEWNGEMECIWRNGMYMEQNMEIWRIGQGYCTIVCAYEVQNQILWRYEWGDGQGYCTVHAKYRTRYIMEKWQR